MCLINYFVHKLRALPPTWQTIDPNTPSVIQKGLSPSLLRMWGDNRRFFHKLYMIGTLIIKRRKGRFQIILCSVSLVHSRVSSDFLPFRAPSVWRDEINLPKKRRNEKINIRNKMGNRLLVVVIAVTIAVSGVAAFLINNHASVAASSTLYRYKVKFEYGYERVIVGAATYPTQRIPVETFTRTHINVFNPNEANVTVYKYFVKIYGEERSLMPPWPEGFDGRTSKTHSILVPDNKGFEIDAEDIRSWPEDPSNPIEWLLGEEFWKGFVVLECDYPLEVVAVYNKDSADIVNKITFHSNFILPPIDTLLGKLKFYEPYELSVTIPWEPANLTLEDVVMRELGLQPDQATPENHDIDTYFDFLECVTKERIVFTLRPTNLLVQEFLNQTWPPEERPPGFVWPDWIWPCKTLTILWKPSINWTEDTYGLRAARSLDDGNYLLSAFSSELLGMGIPDAIIYQIMNVLRIEIIDVDVGEGVGASIDVEYIEPQIITVP